MEKLPSNYNQETKAQEQARVARENMEVINWQMYREQPTIREYEGLPDYPDWELESDQRWLDKKLEKIKSSRNNIDEFSENMEPALACVLNQYTLFPSRESFAFMGSDYDDKAHATDVVLGVKNNKTGADMVFSIDAATGTNENSVIEKFERRFNEYHGTTEIKYCKHGDRKWRERNAPGFVLGMSPSSVQRAFSKFEVMGDKVTARRLDANTDFMILSELREEIPLQMAIMNKERKEIQRQAFMENKEPIFSEIDTRIANMKNFAVAVRQGLNSILDVSPEGFSSEEERNAVFNERYNAKKREMSMKDGVYKNIVLESKYRMNLERGAEALKIAAGQ